MYSCSATQVLIKNTKTTAKKFCFWGTDTFSSTKLELWNITVVPVNGSVGKANENELAFYSSGGAQFDPCLGQEFV